MAAKFSNSLSQFSAVSAASIVPSDSTPLTNSTYAIYVGGAGDVKVILNNDTAAVIFKAVPVGTTLYVQASQVLSTGTTATLLLALY